MPSPTHLPVHNGKEVEEKTEDNTKKSSGTVPYYKLFAFADSVDYTLMVVGVFAAVANGLALPFMTIVFNDVINAFGKTAVHEAVHAVSKVSLKFVYLGLAAAVASFLQVGCWTIAGERQASRVRNLYLKTILRQDIPYFDTEASAGMVVEKMSRDIFLIQDAMGEKAGKFIQLVSSFLGGFIVAFIHGWKLTLVVLAIIPPVVLSTALMLIVLARMAARAEAAYSEAARIVEQTIGSIRTVASFTGETHALNKYEETLKKTYKISVLEGLTGGVGLGVSFGMAFFGYALGTWFGSLMIMNDGYTGGDVINVLMAIVTGSMSLGQTSPCTNAFAAGQAAAFKMFDTICRQPEIDVYDLTGKILDHFEGEIELRDVCFSYPTRPKEPIFTGLSLFIPSGATVALVGESGSGKSTVISLIERFYDPQGGEVLIDKVTLKEFQLRWIRGKIGLVSQEPVLFASSIRDNICYGKDNASLEEIRAAAELANASKFIDNLPQGLDTIVGEHGSQLSGGQKQRVAIARAILKNPRILLLDEATSALDAESERTVQDALDRVMMDRTTVIVAHRLSTIRHASIINVIHKGLVVEKGTHTELLEDPNGVYTQLVHLQQGNQNSDQITPPDQDNTLETTSQLSIHQIPSKQSLHKSDRHSSFSNSFSLDPSIQQSTLKQNDAEQPSQQHQKVSLIQLAFLNKPELQVLLLGVAAAAISGMIVPTFGTLLSIMVQIFYGPPLKLRKDSQFWSLIFTALGLITIISFSARAYLFSVAGSKLVKRVRLMSFDKVVHMEIGWFDKTENSSGAIGSRLSIDAATVRNLVGDSLALLVQNVATLILGLVIAFSACWQLALVIISAIPLISLNAWIQLRFLEGFDATGKKIYAEAIQVASDAVGSIRTVASFTAEEKVMKLYKKKCDGPMSSTIRQSLVSGIGFGFSNFVVMCMYAITFYAGAQLVQHGKTTFTDVFRAFFVLCMTAAGIGQTSTLAPDLTKAKSATASVFAILGRKSEINSADDSGMTLEAVNGNIEFSHVSFRYPTRPDVQVFQDLCLAVQSGKTVALVGESGSGKSTVISLLQRFYDPDNGQILLEGIELRKLQLRWLRQQMGLVSQEPVLFNETIRANIAYGKGGEATEAEILAASEAANAHQFISGLQQGYDTLVGELGVQLSGGQKQRVAIARALVKDPKILLLDEATSALDAESERVVQEALERVMVHRTTIVVAHRLSTIRTADLIAVFRNGIIIEKGNHEALMSIKDGAYASQVALHSST